MSERESRHEHIWELASLGLLVVASFGAFSHKVRAQIYNRDRGRSVESGAQADEAAHYDHTRNENYDTVENGRMLTTREHYLDHYYRRNNGLSYQGNKWALERIWERLSDSERQGLPTPDTF